MSAGPEYVAAHTSHARRGAVAHTFRYRLDYVLIDPDTRTGPWLFSRNRFNLAAVHDRHHGGSRCAGRGADWAREALAQAGAPEGLALRLLTQPSVLGFWFNPVSFWLAFRGDALVAVIAEVSNTFGERHSYLCAHQDFAPISRDDVLTAKKVFHVSPFQDVSGRYSFSFDISAKKIAVRIALADGDEGVIATFMGTRAPMTNRALLAAALRRPVGPLRTLVLIYWNALRLKAKGARYRSRPHPPRQELSR